MTRIASSKQQRAQRAHQPVQASRRDQPTRHGKSYHHPTVAAEIYLKLWQRPRQQALTAVLNNLRWVSTSTHGCYPHSNPYQYHVLTSSCRESVGPNVRCLGGVKVRGFVCHGVPPIGVALLVRQRKPSEEEPKCAKRHSHASRWCTHLEAG